MVTLLLDRAMLEIRLSSTERRLGRLPASIRVERTAIARVQLTDDPWTWLRGARHRGTLIRGVAAIGTWFSASGDDLVVVRGRRLPGVVIDLDETQREAGAEYVRIVLSTNNGLGLTRALRRELDGATDVATIGLAGDGAPGATRPARGSRRPAPAV